MNMITGYVSSTDGRILVDGMDILEEPEKVKKRIGYLPENPPLYTDLTVLEYLRFVGEIKQLSRKEISSGLESVMDLVKVEDVKNRLIRNLSKGYRQRVGLAQALMGNPPVLILDEPTSGLDPKQISEMRGIIRSLGERHTIILSSHILPEVSAVCERVLIINRGELIADDSPDNLSRQVAGQNRLSLRIAADGAAVEKALLSVPSVRRVELAGSFEPGTVDVSVESEDETDIRRSVFEAMRSADCPILMMKPMDLTLEEIFLNLTTEETEAS